MRLELLKTGYLVMPELITAISTNSEKVAAAFCNKILKQYSIGTLTAPLFKNWENRTRFTFDECVIQIMGYYFQLSGNDLSNREYMDKLFSEVELKDVTLIQLADEQAAKDLFTSLSKTKVSLDRKQLDTLVNLAAVFYDTISLQERIYSDEVRVSVLLGLENDFGLYESFAALKCKPSDVLRYCAMLVDPKTSNLPSDVIYSPLSWKQRISVLQFLDTFDYEYLMEELGKNREAWKRFYKHIHLFEQKEFVNRFQKIGFSARVSAGIKERTIPRRYYRILDEMLDAGVVETTEAETLVFRTFASRVKSAIEAKDYEKIIKCLNKQPGYLFRNFATVLNGISKDNESNFIQFVRSKLPKVSEDVLFALLGLNVKAKYRIIDVKGNTIIEDANYPDFIADIQSDIKRELYSRYGYSGKVTVDDDLKDKILPFLSKNSELDRGSKIDFQDSNYLYVFVHWVQNNFERTDLDLSAVTFDENWKSETVYFGNQVNSYITHSGDITNAPAPSGATEYIRIDLKKVPWNKQFIVPIINVYTGSIFSENAVAYVGFKFSNNPKFSLDGDFVRYDLNEPANSNMPFIVDYKNHEITLVDYNNRDRVGFTAHCEIDNMKKLISAVNDKYIITYGVLADILSGDSNFVSKHFTTNIIDPSIDIDPEHLLSIFNK
ncbi:MAG: TerD family protein [Flavobacterium sp.]|nr:TerD family protein [Flavobacterium sp.]